VIQIWKTLSGLHSVQLLIEDLEILEQSFSCLKLEEHVFGWLGRASIRFGCSNASVWFLVWFQVFNWDSYNVGDKILVGFNNIRVLLYSKV